MSEEGHCNFILAGFWELYAHAVLDYQSPLKNFAEIIQIGALEKEACVQLASEPMKTMGLDYEAPALVDQIIESTGQRANLISITCHEILGRLSAEQRRIHAADIMHSLHSEKTLNALKGWGAMTDDEKSCRLDRIIVYATIEKEQFDLAGLLEEFQHLNFEIEMPAIEKSLSRLELGFVLGRNEQGEYFYRVPLFREMIVKDNPKIKLSREIDTWMSG